MQPTARFGLHEYRDFIGLRSQTDIKLSPKLRLRHFKCHVIHLAKAPGLSATVPGLYYVALLTLLDTNIRFQWAACMVTVVWRYVLAAKAVCYVFCLTDR